MTRAIYSHVLEMMDHMPYISITNDMKSLHERKGFGP